MDRVDKARQDINGDIFIQFTTNEDLIPGDIISVTTQDYKVHMFTIINIYAINKIMINVEAKMQNNSKGHETNVKDLMYENIEIELTKNDLEETELDEYKKGFKDGIKYADSRSNLVKINL